MLAGVAISVSLPMAWVSLGKLMLLLGAVGVAWGHWRDRAVGQVAPAGASAVATAAGPHRAGADRRAWLGPVTVLALTAWVASLLWTQAPLPEALHALGKHAKLAEVLLLGVLVRNRTQAVWALKAYLLGMAFFIVSAWAMVAGVVPPWASDRHLVHPLLRYSLYSTYLDQTLIFASAAAVAWHLRARWSRWQTTLGAVAVLAVLNNLAVQEGRTGWLVTLALIGLALWWRLGRRARWVALAAAPVMLAATLAWAPGRFQERWATAWAESTRYAQTGAADSSLGFRLHAWQRSVQALAQSPWLGHGVGSWTQTVRAIEGARADAVFGTGRSNPHQEFLLWAVSLGVAGPALLLAWLVALARDLARAAPDVRHAGWSVLTALTLACLFNSSLYDALVGDFFVVSLGLLWSLARHEPMAATVGAVRPGDAP